MFLDDVVSIRQAEPHPNRRPVGRRSDLEQRRLLVAGNAAAGIRHRDEHVAAVSHGTDRDRPVTFDRLVGVRQ